MASKHLLLEPLLFIIINHIAWPDPELATRERGSYSSAGDLVVLSANNDGTI